MRIRIISLILALCALLGVGLGALAAEVDCDSVYCFTGQEFQSEEEAVTGVCITGLPDASAGTVLLGSRVLRAGDILTADQLKQLTFQPLRTETDAQATISYLPIYKNRVEKNTTMTISIRGKQDNAPTARDLAIETYKNLPREGVLQATDPEGAALRFTLVRGPKRGSVEVREDGSFTYTPKKNKVGVDSFTYTACDPAGNVSREATVTVQILKPADAQQYTDTAGLSCRFAAEWMKNTGLFVGEEVGGNACFGPEKGVSRGEFLAMTVKLLEIPLTGTASEVPATTPEWLKPYLAAAQRSGLMDNFPTDGTLNTPITGAEAAVMLQNALELSVSAETLAAAQTAEKDGTVPTWAGASLTVMAQYGMEMDADAALTRADAAELLYTVSQVAPDAPGMTVLRMQM